MKHIFLYLFFLITLYSKAQVGIGTKIPEPSAMLEVKSNSKGVLISRMTESERSSIKSPSPGLLVYQTEGNAGFYYHTGEEWKYLPPAAISSAAQPINSLTTTTTTSIVASVAGTANRITSTGGTAPVINIASTYVGQSSITTLGTIGTGTWNGTVISSAKGGAGTVNGLLKANGSGTVSAAVSGTDYLKPNTAITAATKTKLTYNAQGLVTGGSDALTTDIAEGTNKYYTDARSRAALSLTTTGTSGAATYSSSTGVLNIPQYSGGSGGTTYSFASPLALNTGTVSIPQATSVTSGYLTSTDWNTFNNKLSTATAASTYAPIVSPTFIGTVNGITKSMVGLGDVDNTSDLNKVISTATQTALDNKLNSNPAITGSTKTKITYDSKGLVNSGADATTTDIAEGTNLYFTLDRTLNTKLSGLKISDNSSVFSTDHILDAIGKLQAQVNDRALVIPKLTFSERLSIQSPAEGLQVYQTDSTKGFWFFDGLVWKNFVTNPNSINGEIKGIQGITSYVIPNDSLYYYGKAIGSCFYFSYNGFNDWRIPTQEEMIKIISLNGINIFGTEPSIFWTSTTVMSNPNQVGGSSATYRPVGLVVNTLDYQNNPIGPYFEVFNPYKYYSYGQINPDKARIIYVR